MEINSVPFFCTLLFLFQERKTEILQISNFLTIDLSKTKNKKQTKTQEVKTPKV